MIYKLKEKIISFISVCLKNCLFTLLLIELISNQYICLSLYKKIIFMSDTTNKSLKDRNTERGLTLC